MKPTCKAVLARLRAADGAWISGNRLFEVGGTRYGARVFELRHLHGHVIERRSARNGSAVDEYRLVEQPEQLRIAL